ncbi:hypothetical protein ACIBCR_16455 [Micromonospora echinospora]|uniref:hypothetical protein n=1 Tax=Micromonospora echinospora TaxID=1877 RepID=UPI00378CF8AB
MRPDPELVEHHRQRIAKQPKGTRGGYTLGYLAASIRKAAEDHDRQCAACSTCTNLHEMLAVVLAYELNEAPPDILRRIHGVGDEE